MAQRVRGNKSTGAKQVSINDYSQIKGWPQTTKTIRTKKIDKNLLERSPKVPTTATIKNNKDRQGRQQPTVPLTPQIPLSSLQGKPHPTNAGRLIQPNNLLKVLTANVQSLSLKIVELIALIQVENFDVNELNETWLDTQNKYLLAEVDIHGYMVFQVYKPTPTGRGCGSIMYVKNTLTNRKKVISHLNT